MLNVDYVIYCPIREEYAYYEFSNHYQGFSFGTIMQADGFNDAAKALNHITGLISPTGRVLVKKDPEIEGCVVLKRTTMTEVEPA
ncbi:Hypothetical protein KNT65_gp292 [Escherichia phage EcS1]|uniref:Uncharacterized protein n=1 Tax=Escherichia phage EcS1 TaxID=2083276 RepID=A0A2Z5ZCN1_9CAUD|nr:Hypothetical protein KNT65_gp292 [Escherichia phage EcS1]BBC78201.1 Hypothetical protein [Escherichia phage EcS1]